MTVVRWNPFRDMAAMQNVFDRLFYDTWRPYVQAQQDVNTLPVDAYETADGYSIAANIPGVSADNIQVRFENGFLFLWAEVPEPAVQQEGTRALFLERPTGQFSRRIQLPNHVDFNSAEATYENGVLTLHLPKRPEAQPRTLTIKTVNGNGTLQANN